MVGYSGKPLAEKLGLTKATTVVILSAPKEYKVRLPFPPSVRTTLVDNADFIQVFSKEKKELEMLFPRLKKCLTPAGALWISWPKGGSKITTDLNENIIREIGVHNGLVDVKVIAVDQQWSGLKFVYRLKDRQ